MHLRTTLTGWLKLLSILMLLIHCFMYTSHCLCRFCVWSIFCYALLSVLSSFGIILPRKITPVAFALIVFVMSSLSSSRCRGWSTVCGCGPGHTHLLFFTATVLLAAKTFIFLRLMICFQLTQLQNIIYLNVMSQLMRFCLI